MRLIEPTNDTRFATARTPSVRMHVTNGVKNGARGIRTAATVLPARLAGFFANLGPRLTTGAADDDPSGISTYSVTGAAFGYAPLWTAIVSFPLMVSVQLLCARLGMVTGRGLAGNVLHNPDHGGDPARTRRDAGHHRAAGGGRPATARRQRSVLALHARHHRNRDAERSHPRRVVRLRSPRRRRGAARSRSVRTTRGGSMPSSSSRRRSASRSISSTSTPSRCSSGRPW
jgi:hypothetical protein